MRQEAADWLAESQADLETARDLTATSHFNNAVFFAHQSVEKALKAAHIHLRQEAPPRTHGLRQLAEGVFGRLPQPIWRRLRELDPQYTVARYPTPMAARPSEHYTEQDAQDAMDAAAEVLAWLEERIREKR